MPVPELPSFKKVEAPFLREPLSFEFFRNLGESLEKLSFSESIFSKSVPEKLFFGGIIVVSAFLLLPIKP